MSAMVSATSRASRPTQTTWLYIPARMKCQSGVSVKPSKLTVANINTTSTTIEPLMPFVFRRPAAGGLRRHSLLPSSRTRTSVTENRPITPNMMENASPRLSHTSFPYTNMPAQVMMEYPRAESERLCGMSLYGQTISAQANHKNRHKAGHTPMRPEHGCSSDKESPRPHFPVQRLRPGKGDVPWIHQRPEIPYQRAHIGQPPPTR